MGKGKLVHWYIKRYFPLHTDSVAPRAVFLSHRVLMRTRYVVLSGWMRPPPVPVIPTDGKLFSTRKASSPVRNAEPEHYSSFAHCPKHSTIDVIFNFFILFYGARLSKLCHILSILSSAFSLLPSLSVPFCGALEIHLNFFPEIKAVHPTSALSYKLLKDVQMKLINEVKFTSPIKRSPRVRRFLLSSTCWRFLTRTLAIDCHQSKQKITLDIVLIGLSWLGECVC